MGTVVAAALGECVHVAGVANFLRLAEAAGWRTVFLGPAVPIADVLEAARREKADMVGVSYRLTPETGERLVAEFAEAADDLRTAGVRFVFGSTPPVAERVRAFGFFEQYGIQPVTGAAGTVRNALEQFLSGALGGVAPCRESIEHDHGHGPESAAGEHG